MNKRNVPNGLISTTDCSNSCSASLVFLTANYGDEGKEGIMKYWSLNIERMSLS